MAFFMEVKLILPVKSDNPWLQKRESKNRRETAPHFVAGVCSWLFLYGINFPDYITSAFAQSEWSTEGKADFFAVTFGIIALCSFVLGYMISKFLYTKIQMASGRYALTTIFLIVGIILPPLFKDTNIFSQQKNTALVSRINDLSDSKLEQGLRDAISMLQKGLPKKIDSQTTLVSAQFFGKVIEHTYAVDLSLNEQAAFASSEDILSRALSVACLDKFLKVPLDKGYRHTVIYQNLNGQEIRRISTSKILCTKAGY